MDKVGSNEVLIPLALFAGLIEENAKLRTVVRSLRRMYQRDRNFISCEDIFAVTGWAKGDIELMNFDNMTAAGDPEIDA